MYDPCGLASRLLKNDVEAMGTQEFRMSQATESSTGCSKRPSSKAAASEEARRTLCAM
jgi:hypothetical protein